VGFQRESGEAPPEAEKASRFRGSGVIGRHEVPGNRDAAAVFSALWPRPQARNPLAAPKKIENPTKRPCVQAANDAHCGAA